MISIIIPIYNRVDTFMLVMDSIDQQSCGEYECILVDDGSEEWDYQAISDRIKGHPKVRLYRRPDELLKGANACRNFGYQMSSGEFVLWWDSDDEMNLNLIETLANRIKVDAFELLVFRCNSISDNHVEEYGSPISDMDSLSMQFLSHKLKLLTHNCLWNKSFLANKLLFNERVLKMQEVECYSRLLLSVKKIAFEHNVLYDYHYKTENSTTLNGETKKEFIESNLYTSSIILNLINSHKKNIIQQSAKGSWESIFFRYYKNAIKNRKIRSVWKYWPNLVIISSTGWCFKIRLFMFVLLYFFTGKGRSKINLGR
jgi:glycosyltransferase involved in cell wall biosynthesis